MFNNLEISSEGFIMNKDDMTCPFEGGVLDSVPTVRPHPLGPVVRMPRSLGLEGAQSPSPAMTEAFALARVSRNAGSQLNAVWLLSQLHWVRCPCKLILVAQTLLVGYATFC